MKNKTLLVIVITTLLLSISCKSQNTYSQETLKNQSEKIIRLKKSDEFSKIAHLRTVDDIVKNLKVRPNRFIAAPDYSGEKVIKKVFFVTLYFENRTEFFKKLDKKIKLYNIDIYLKEPISEESGLLLARSTKGVWNKEAEQFFGKMEVKDIKIYDLEK